jgi:hypothetical protein
VRSASLVLREYIPGQIHVYPVLWRSVSVIVDLYTIMAMQNVTHDLKTPFVAYAPKVLCEYGTAQQTYTSLYSLGSCNSIARIRSLIYIRRQAQPPPSSSSSSLFPLHSKKNENSKAINLFRRIAKIAPATYLFSLFLGFRQHEK